jgi:hypothetical protein
MVIWLHAQNPVAIHQALRPRSTNSPKGTIFQPAAKIQPISRNSSASPRSIEQQKQASSSFAALAPLGFMPTRLLLFGTLHFQTQHQSGIKTFPKTKKAKIERYQVTKDETTKEALRRNITSSALDGRRSESAADCGDQTTKITIKHQHSSRAYERLTVATQLTNSRPCVFIYYECVTSALLVGDARPPTESE